MDRTLITLSIIAWFIIGPPAVYYFSGWNLWLISTVMWFGGPASLMLGLKLWDLIVDLRNEVRMSVSWFIILMVLRGMVIAAAVFFILIVFGVVKPT